MVNRKDVCKCGHLREDHNNRIIPPFYPEMKFNCCLNKNDDDFCYCNKFTLLRKASLLTGVKTSQEIIDMMDDADNSTVITDGSHYDVKWVCITDLYECISRVNSKLHADGKGTYDWNELLCDELEIK